MGGDRGLRHWARRARRELAAVAIAAGNRRTPRAARIAATIVLAYALSPIDLIPDAIPILGQLDDLILVPLGLVLAVRLIPPDLMRRFRAVAARRAGGLRCRGALAVTAATWVALALVLAWSLS